MTIPKFRKAKTAPVEIVATHISDFPSWRPEPIKILANAWKNSKEKLNESCANFLESVDESELEKIRDILATQG